MSVGNWLSRHQDGGVIALAIVIAVLVGYFATHGSIRYVETHLKCEEAQQHGRGAPSVQSAPNNQVSAEEEQRRRNQREEADVCAQKRMALAARDQAAFTYYALLVLALTLALTAVAAYAALRTVHTMRDTAKRELRAYVNYDTGRISGTLGIEGETSLVRIQIKNFGQTPAYRLRARNAVARLPWPPEEESFILPDEPNSFGVLGPTHHFTMVRRLPDPAFPIGTLELLRRGEVAIFVYGEIEYEDAFGNPHTTTFRVMHGGPIGTRTDGVLSAHERGNDAD